MSAPFYHIETPRESSSRQSGAEKTGHEKSSQVTITQVEPFHSVEDREAAQAAHSQQQQHDRHRVQSTAERWWLWEFSAWVVCVAALLGMVGFLYPADQKAVPKWVLSQTIKGYTLGFSVSINSVLSIFSTIVKSAVMIPVAASIGQLKWLWFSDGHKLADFQKFDAAKGGPLGSVLLIWAMKGRTLVCLGALITIGSLALDFSFQQLVTYPPHPVDVKTAYMPASPTYSSFALTEDVSDGAFSFQAPTPDSLMSTALKFGLYGINASVDIVPDCVSGNCTWANTIATIGVCSECFDATPKIVESCGTYNYSGGSSPYCNYSYAGASAYDDPNLLLSGILDSDTGVQTIFAASAGYGPSAYGPSSSMFFKKIAYPVGLVTTIGITRGDQNRINATGTECALFYCVKKYSASVNQTVLHEKLVDIYRDDTATIDSSVNQDTGETTGSGDYHISAPASFMKDTGHNGSFQFTVTSNASAIFNSYFYTKGHFSGSLEVNPTGHVSGMNDFLEYIWPLTTKGYSTAMSSIAGNITNAMRMSNHGTSVNTNAAGTTWQDQPKVNVVWWWISIPAALVMLSLLFLLLTMVESARRGALLWKSSPLAAFYHPLTKEGREELSQASGPKHLEEIAENLTVKAERTDKGLRFVHPE